VEAEVVARVVMLAVPVAPTIAVAPAVYITAVVVVVARLAMAAGLLEAVALFGVFGPVPHVHSHRLIQEICNESLYSN
jgi:hypothetical protein